MDFGHFDFVLLSQSQNSSASRIPSEGRMHAHLQPLDGFREDEDAGGGDLPDCMQPAGCSEFAKAMELLQSGEAIKIVLKPE